MKLIKIVDIHLHDLAGIFNKDIVAFIAIISINGYQQAIEIEELLNYGFSKKDINQLLLDINQFFSVKKTPDGYIIMPKQATKSNHKQKLEEFWGLMLDDFINDDTYLRNLTNQIYQARNNLTCVGLIKDDLEIYYKHILAGDFIKQYNLALSRSDILLLNQWLVKTDLDIIIFKFAFEQSIIQNFNQCFNANFFDKIIASYDKMHIKTIDEAQRFNEKRNQHLQQQAKTYIKPTYELEESQILNQDELERIKGLINE